MWNVNISFLCFAHSMNQQIFNRTLIHLVQWKTWNFIYFTPIHLVFQQFLSLAMHRLNAKHRQKYETYKFNNCKLRATFFFVCSQWLRNEIVYGADDDIKTTTTCCELQLVGEIIDFSVCSCGNFCWANMNANGEAQSFFLLGKTMKPNFCYHKKGRTDEKALSLCASTLP